MRASAQRAGRRIRLIRRAEQPQDAQPLDRGRARHAPHPPFGQGTDPGNTLKPALHQKLAAYDDRGEAHPQLAVALPSTAAGTWLLRPDGTMRTTYRLRPGVTWHDSAPLTARDFVFAWTVYVDPDLPMASRQVASKISRIDTPDHLMLVLEWTSTFPYANAIDEDDLGPMPAHILEGDQHHGG